VLVEKTELEQQLEALVSELREQVKNLQLENQQNEAIAAKTQNETAQALEEAIAKNNEHVADIAFLQETINEQAAALDGQAALISELQNLPTASVSELPSFEHDGEKFEVILPKAQIPGIGIRTALEICTDEKAQAYLVRRCVGSVIRLVDSEDEE
jgi:hypothetical protein